MAIYWEGTVTLSGLAAGDYRTGALVRLALPQDTGEFSVHFALLSDFDADGSGAPVDLPVRSRYAHDEADTFDPNTLVGAAANLCRYGTPDADGGPETIPLAQGACIADSVSVTQVFGLSLAFTYEWETQGSTGPGWALPTHAFFIDHSTLRVGWWYEGDMPTPEEWSSPSTVWTPENYALSDPSISILGVYPQRGPPGIPFVAGGGACVDLAVAGAVPGTTVTVTAPQYQQTAQGMWVKPGPSVVSNTVPEPPVTIPQPVDVTVTLETDTPEARATVTQTLGGVFGSLHRAESLPPTFAEDCIAGFPSIGIVLQAITFSATTPASPMHRLVLGAVTFAAGTLRRQETGSDVRFFHTADGGEIEFVERAVTMADGLETAVYLSLFGGNERDSGLSAHDRLQWWGNLSETDQQRQYRSETQHLLRSLPAIPANLRRIEDALTRDLGWLTADIASEVTAVATIPRLNSVAIDVDVTMKTGTKYQFQFATGWSVQT